MNRNFAEPLYRLNNIGRLSVAWWASYRSRQCGACTVRLEDDSIRCAALPGRLPGGNRRCEQRGWVVHCDSAYPSAGPGKTSELANLSVTHWTHPINLIYVIFYCGAVFKLDNLNFSIQEIAGIVLIVSMEAQSQSIRLYYLFKLSGVIVPWTRWINCCMNFYIHGI